MMTRWYCSRAFLFLACATMCVAVVACGGGGGGGHHAAGPIFRCSDAAAAQDVVALFCSQRTQQDVWRINVIIGGPTISTDISGFNFDVVFDPADLSYVSGSAVLGTLLNQDGDDPLLAVSVASNDPGRLIVGVHRTNQPNGVQGSAPLNLILQFSMRANLLSQFGPVLLQFQYAEGVDSSVAPIGSITFSDQLLLSVQ